MPILAGGPGHTLAVHSKSFAVRAHQRCDYLAKGETMNYRTLNSCQNQPRSLTPCQAASADNIGMLVLMGIEPPQQWILWTRNRICIPQSREESNGDKENVAFPVQHQCSVRANGESATVARALQEINMQCELKSSSRGLLATTAPASASRTNLFLYNPESSKCPHPSITDLTEAKSLKPKSLSKNACAPARHCNVILNAEESGSTARFTICNAVGNPNRLC